MNGEPEKLLRKAIQLTTINTYHAWKGVRNGNEYVLRSAL
jgi:hypothetical protein